MSLKGQVFVDIRTAIARLSEQSKELSLDSLRALSGASKSDLTALAQIWARLPVERRQEISQMLVELAEDNFDLDYNLLFRYLFNDDDAQVRTHGIEGLWEDEDPALIKPFVAFLRSDPDTRVRAAAAEALGRFMLQVEYERLTQSSHITLIHEALLATIRSASEDMNVRCRAVESLAYSSDEIVRDVITAAYADDDSLMRASAVCAMGHSADEYWRKTVIQELDSADPQMRFQAARAAGELEARAATPRLIELLDDPEREVQRAAITALGQIGGKMAQDALTQAAISDDRTLSDLAAQALQELEFSSNSDPLLLDIAIDEDWDETDYE